MPTGRAGTLTRPRSPAGPSRCVPPCDQPHPPRRSRGPSPPCAATIRACGPCPCWVGDGRRTVTSGLQRQAHSVPFRSSQAPHTEAPPFPTVKLGPTGWSMGSGERGRTRVQISAPPLTAQRLMAGPPPLFPYRQHRLTQGMNMAHSRDEALRPAAPPWPMT